MIKCSSEAYAKCKEHCHHCKTPDEAYYLEGSDCNKFNQQINRRPMTNAPAEAVIPVDTVKSYLLGLIDEWNNLGGRKYELPNMQVYNHIRKELDDLEEYISKHFPTGDCK